MKATLPNRFYCPHCRERLWYRGINGVIVVFALLVHAFLDATRADMMRRASVRFDRALSGTAFDAIQRAIVRRPMDNSLPTLRDVDTLRDMIGSPALTSVLDVIWLPIFLIACYIMHPIFAVAVLVTSGLIAVLTVMTSRSTDEPMGEFWSHPFQPNDNGPVLLPPVV